MNSPDKISGIIAGYYLNIISIPLQKANMHNNR